MSTMVYIQTNKSVEVHKGIVQLKEIAHVVCSNAKIQERCNNLCVMDLSGKAPGPYGITALELIDYITSKISDVDVSHMGEVGIVVNYEPHPSAPGLWDYIKTAFVCFILFFGAGFSIMTFNTDVNTKELFSNLHQELVGVPSSGFTEMELLYSIGIGIGVVFFFNHFSFKKKKKDPSALEVKMCLYEKDVDTTVLDQESKGTRST